MHDLEARFNASFNGANSAAILLHPWGAPISSQQQQCSSSDCLEDWGLLK